jgi:hypothetical protein
MWSQRDLVPRPSCVLRSNWVRQYGLLFDGWVGPYGQGTVWSMSHRSTGASQPGHRHVRSRHRTNSAVFFEGDNPHRVVPSAQARA